YNLESPAADHGCADLHNERPEGALLLSDQGRVDGDTVHHAERHAFLDLGHARGVEEDLHRALLTVTGDPARTVLNTLGSPAIRPTTLTGLAGRISPPRLIGVGPKKMQNARPGGQ